MAVHGFKCRCDSARKWLGDCWCYGYCTLTICFLPSLFFFPLRSLSICFSISLSDSLCVCLSVAPFLSPPPSLCLWLPLCVSLSLSTFWSPSPSLHLRHSVSLSLPASWSPPPSWSRCVSLPIFIPATPPILLSHPALFHCPLPLCLVTDTQVICYRAHCCHLEWLGHHCKHQGSVRALL